MTAHNRGEHRPFFEAWFDGKDYRQLSPEARLTLLTLKGTLGACGIKADPGLEMAIARRTGLDAARSDASLSELAAAGWIERDDDVIWLVRGFEFEPQLIASNPKHRTFVARVIGALPRVPIVDRFRAHYAAWFPNTPSIPYRKGIGITSPSPSPTSNTESGPTDSLGGREGNPQSRVENRPAPLVADATRNGNRGTAPLPFHAAKLVRTLYGTAPKKRQADGGEQLRHTLGAGARFEGKHRVQAVDADHLDDVCRRVLADPPRKHDAAVRHVLLKLRDTYGQTKASREKVAHAEPPRRRAPDSKPTPIGELVRATA